MTTIERRPDADMVIRLTSDDGGYKDDASVQANLLFEILQELKWLSHRMDDLENQIRRS